VSPNFQANLWLCWKNKKLELPSALTSVQGMHNCLALAGWLAGCKIGNILDILGQITAPSASRQVPNAIMMDECCGLGLDGVCKLHISSGMAK